jgi:hypothetical protein
MPKAKISTFSQVKEPAPVNGNSDARDSSQEPDSIEDGDDIDIDDI